jgi:magnesium transporter
MPESSKQFARKAGLPPGSLVHVGRKRSEKVLVRVVNYDAESYVEREVDPDAVWQSCRDLPGITWINVDGLHRTELVAAIGTDFDIHPLVQEDILNTTHRPKLDDTGGQLFIQLRALSYTEKGYDLESEQISILCGPHYLHSFQEKPGDVFDAVRQRLQKSPQRRRFLGPDYLCYVLMDTIIDEYFVTLEKIGERLDQLEEELLSNPKPTTQQQLHAFKRKLLVLRNSVWPLREVIGSLERGDHPLVQDETRPYYRDIYEHTVQVIETVETYRDLVSGMLDSYLSVLSNRMNEVMKVLTVIATIFIPLTFLAGVYGMNFKHFPELEYSWFYPWGFWGGMAAITGGMLYYFWKRKWL